MAFPIRRWALLLSFVAACVAGSAPGTARADRIADKRAEAARVETQLNALYARVDAAVEAYDAARARLHHVKLAIAANTQRLRIAHRELRVARGQLAHLLVSGYKDQQPDVAVYVLGARSFTDLVDRLDFVSRTSREQADLLAQIAGAEHRIAVHQAELRREQRAAARLLAQATARRREARALVAHQQTVLAGIKRDIASLIRQAQERRDRLARQRAAAAARARAAAAKAARQQQQQAQTPAPAPSSGSAGGSGDSPPPAPQPAPPPAGTLGQKAVAIAMGELGVPYVWGGASPAGFDCSGLTMWVYAQLGVQLDHYTGSQWNAGPHVAYNDLQPGDLVFFEPTIGHVGLYIGNGLFIHAPHTGDVVKISSLSDPWYSSEYQGAVRIVG